MAQNRRELIDAVFHNQKADRVPVGFWHHFLDNPRRNGFGKPGLHQEVLVKQAKFYQDFQPDLLKVMTDGYFGYPHPALEKKLISPEEILDMKPLGRNSDWYREQIRYAKELVRSYGKEVQIFYNLFTPHRVFTFTQGTVDAPFDLVPWIKEEPEALRKALDIISEDYALLARGLIEEGGVDGIYLSVNSIDYDRVTEKEYASVIAESEIKVLEAANSVRDNSILHICGFKGFRNHLEWYKNYPALVINWAAHVEQVSLSEGKKLFGGKAVIGGFGQTEDDLIYTGTKAELVAETDQLLKDAGTVGVILGADCTIPIHTDVDHLHWVQEEAARLSGGLWSLLAVDDADITKAV